MVLYQRYSTELDSKEYSDRGLYLKGICKERITGIYIGNKVCYIRYLYRKIYRNIVGKGLKGR